MIFLYSYFGIGLVTLIVVLWEDRLCKQKESDRLRELGRAINPDRRQLSLRLLEDFVLPVIAAVVMVALWPTAFYMLFRTELDKRKAALWQKIQDFTVEGSYLKECLSVQEIESREMVEDPLGAVPQLPFGHLNGVWRSFLESRTGADEIWSFSAEFRPSRRCKVLRAGYVLVRGNNPGRYFLTVMTEKSRFR